MELMITGAFAEKVVLLLKKDRGLAVSLAEEWLGRIDASTIANYLVTPEIAVDLLAQRLVGAPAQTVEELQAIAGGRAVKAATKAPRRGRRKAAAKKTVVKKRGPRKAATKKAATRKAATKKTTTRKAATRKATTRKAATKKAVVAKPGIRRRKRLSSAQIADLKGTVIAFLAGVSAASRKEIIASAKIPTPAIYNRVVAELRDEALVDTEGQKAKAVYFLTKKGKKATKRRR